MRQIDASIRLHTCTVPRFGRTVFWSYLGSINNTYIISLLDSERIVVFDFVDTCLVVAALVRFPPFLQITLALHKFTIMGIGQLLALMLPQKRT